MGGELDSAGSGYVPMAGLYEHGNESSVCVRKGDCSLII
jgi:hypothetical protein